MGLADVVWSAVIGGYPDPGVPMGLELGDNLSLQRDSGSRGLPTEVVHSE